MVKGAVIPVVTLGKDADGRPTRVSVPGLKSAPIMSGGVSVGRVDGSGRVSWAELGSAGSWDRYAAIAAGQDMAKWRRRGWQATYIDGELAAIVVPRPKSR